MKAYQFQYTKIRDTLFVLFGCVLVCFVLIAPVVFFRLPEWVAIVVAPALSIALYFRVRRYAVRYGTAQLSDTRLELVLGEIPMTIDFQDVVSFKSYDGNNGTVLYLNTPADHFTLSANNNFCDTEAFESFCADVIAQLDQYKEKDNRALVHEGSVYATNGFLCFLIAATAAYLLAFAIEPPGVRPYIGTWGGFCLTFMWWGCLYKRSDERRRRPETANKAVN